MGDQPMMANEAAAPAGETKPKKLKWKRWLALVILVPAVGFSLYTWIMLSFSYSKGDRAGYLQKFSEKGWLCKTWEGEIAMANLPGTMPEVFDFTVRNDSVAQVLRGMAGQRVAIIYEQHKGVPTSCFGDTQYYVVGVNRLAPPTQP
jgi:hypothetical protein